MGAISGWAVGTITGALGGDDPEEVRLGESIVTRLNREDARFLWFVLTRV